MHFRTKWAAPGDINAFFGLMLDNIANLLLVVGLLSALYNFPAAFAIRYMIPGTAVGVLLGDLLYFWMALDLARRTNRTDVTAMPLGLDTPSTFGMVFFVLGPAFRAAQSRSLTDVQAATYAWHIGMCSLFYSGLFKLACAVISDRVRRGIPRAGLLGSLAAIALVLISFLPLMDILSYPVVGMLSLAIILTTLIARIPFPGRWPGAMAAVLVGGALYYVLRALDLVAAPEAAGFDPNEAWFPTEWLAAFGLGWMQKLPEATRYLPIVLPFALGTVVGGIDCTESAAAAGDEYPTGKIISVEAVATLAAAFCGGVIQTTPYIGHPAYKAMGGRAAYTLATALFVGGAGLIGYFGYLYIWIPKAAAFPILIFVGLEITAQSFYAVPRRHYTAVALACVPALAFLALNFADQVLLHFGQSVNQLRDESLQRNLVTLRLLSNGFIVTSLIWAAALAAIIDRRLAIAGTYFAVAALLSLVGIIHSPLPGGATFLPWTLTAADRQMVFHYAASYAVVSGLLFLWAYWLGNATYLSEKPSDHELSDDAKRMDR